MSILINNSAKLNEVIFANRNKNYGAYAIRSSYNTSLLKSLGFLGGMVFMLFVLVVINKNKNNNEIQKIILVDELDSVLSIEYHVVEPDQPEVVKPLLNEIAAAAPSGGVPDIKDNAVTTVSVNLLNPMIGQGTSTATGVSPISVIESTNTAITVIQKNVIDNTEHFVSEEMPEFNSNPNGIFQYVSSNIVYPIIAKEIGREGTVYVSFVVNQLGDVEGAKILKGIGYGCDEEVMRVITKMPTWKKPGKNNGKPVKVRYNIPVSFKLR